MFGLASDWGGTSWVLAATDACLNGSPVHGDLPFARVRQGFSGTNCSVAQKFTTSTGLLAKILKAEGHEAC